MNCGIDLLTRQKTAEEIVEVGRRLHSRNLLAAADGNISVRLSADCILMTPTGVNKGYLHPSDMAIIDLENKIISGNPSGERLMHLEIYRRCPQARAIVHAHPPTAIAWSIAHPELQELPSTALSEVILAVGKIPLANYARPSTQDMGEVLAPFLPEHRVLILSRHGGLSWGEDLMEAYNGMERLEHSAQILKSAWELGGITSLEKKEIEFLQELRKKIGPRTF